MINLNEIQETFFHVDNSTDYTYGFDNTDTDCFLDGFNDNFDFSSHYRKFHDVPLLSNGNVRNSFAIKNDNVILIPQGKILKSIYGNILFYKMRLNIINDNLLRDSNVDEVTFFYIKKIYDEAKILLDALFLFDKEILSTQIRLLRHMLKASMRNTIFIMNFDEIIDSYKEETNENSWYDLVVEEQVNIHDNCSEIDHNASYDELVSSIVDEVINEVCVINTKSKSITEMYFEELSKIHVNDNSENSPMDKVIILNCDYVSCNCSIYCLHLEKFLSNYKNVSHKKEQKNEFDLDEQKKHYYITNYSNLMTKKEISEMFEMTLSDCLKKLKTLNGFEESFSTVNEKLFVNPNYFKNSFDNEEISFMFDTNVFISHLISPIESNIVFSKTVMFEIIKLKKHSNAFKRFFKFMFSCPNVKFPEISYEKSRPSYYDDNIIKEIPENCILVTDDKELRERLGSKSMSYGFFSKTIRPKKTYKNLTLSPRACKFFLDTFNWSIENPKIVDNSFFFIPVIPESKKNSLISLNYESETLIDIPESIENIKIDMQIPDMDSEPLVDVSDISDLDVDFLDKINYEFPYKPTKMSNISIDDYKNSLQNNEELSLTDEIFPIEESTEVILESFVKSSNLKRMTNIKKRGTDIFYNDMNLQYRFEKRSENNIQKCVKSSNRVKHFFDTFKTGSKDFLLVDSPIVDGPYDVNLSEIRTNSGIRSLRLLSKLFEDMIYQLSVKLKPNEIIVRDNGLPFGFILYPGRGDKMFKTIRSYRLIFRNSSKGVWEPEATYNDYSVSRCYTESIEDIKYKSDLFDNLLPIYLRGIMTDEEFIQLYYHIFWANTSSKKQLGFLKFYTVISESIYSNLENLVEKYLMNPYKREIHFLYQEKLYDMINKNMSGSFNSLFSQSRDVFDFIDSNSVFVYNKKTGQNRFHSFKQFITDIDQNCDEFEQKFHGIKFDTDETMTGKFVYLPVMKESFKIFREKLKKRNVTSDTILENFKHNIVDDFGVFKSANGSLDMNDEFKKKKCIETYLSELESQGEFSDELTFISNCINNKKNDERLTGLSKKPQAEGTNREIYITNVKKRCQLFIIQSFFKVLCKLSEIDMVVEGQFEKFELIQESSLNTGSKSFLNADMGKWSPQDCKEKFDYCLEILIELGIVPDELVHILRNCMKTAKDFLIIIPKDITNSDFFESFRSDTNRSFENHEFKENNYLTMSFDYGWPQGMFHNISSFIHSCSCDIVDKVLKSKNKNIISNKFFVSSDDKNLVTNYKSKPTLNELKQIMEITDKVSLCFSLESSKTKNSISDSLTEMISVINYKGTIIYSPMKSLANMKSSFDDICFIKNHKNILSRICTFFGMSNRLALSEYLYQYYFKVLCEHYGIEYDNLAPISCFGAKSCSIIEYHRDSESYDNLCKYIKSPQQVFDYLTNVKEMKVIDNFKSDRIKKLLDRKRGLIEHYKSEMRKTQFEVDMKFVIGMEYNSIESGKKRMFLNKSDASFNSYYYKSRKPIYLIKDEKTDARKAISKLSRPTGIDHELSNLIYRSRTVANSFLTYRNLISNYEKQYKPEGKLHYIKNRSYENISSSFNDLLLFITNPIGISKNPFYSRKIDTMIRDVRNVCKSLRITTIEEFESSEYSFNELKQRSKSNLYYRLQHNGENETLDYNFETKKMDIIDPSFIVENLEFKSEINNSSKTFTENFKQIFNTLCFDIKVLKINESEALKKSLYSYQEMCKGFRLENIESYVSSMSDVYQLFNLKIHPDMNVKFHGRGKLRLEWESINNNLSVVKVKNGLRDICSGIVDEFDRIIVLKEENKTASKVLRIDNLNFEINQEKFLLMSKGYEEFFRLNEKTPEINSIEIRTEKKLFLEFSGPNFRTKKLVPINKVNKDHVTVQYRSLNDYLVTVKKIGNIAYVKGNNIKGDLINNLNFDMKSKISSKDLENYKTVIEDEFGCDVYFCRHRNECEFKPIRDQKKYVKVCSSSFKWEYYVNSEKISEMSFKSTEKVKEKLETLNDFDTSEFLEDLYCKNKIFKNGKDLFNVFNKRLTKKDSMIVSRAIRSKLLTEKEILNAYVYDPLEESIVFNDGFDNFELKPKKNFTINFYKCDEELSIPQGVDDKYFLKIPETKEICPDKFEQIRKKYYEYLDLKNKASQKSEEFSKNKFINIHDDIQEKKKIRNYFTDLLDPEDELSDEELMYKDYSEKALNMNHLKEMIEDNEDLLDFFDFETNLYYMRTQHTEEDCDEDMCFCEYNNFLKFLGADFESLHDEIKRSKILEFRDKGIMKESYIDEAFFIDEILGNQAMPEEIKLSCQCNENFNCFHEEIQSSENVQAFVNDAKKENFSEFYEIIENYTDLYKKNGDILILYNSKYVFLPNIDANFMDPKNINKDLYISNEFEIPTGKVNLSEIFKEISVQMKETMEDNEIEEKIIEEKNRTLGELSEDQTTKFEFSFYKDVEKPKIENINDVKIGELDSRSERVLRISPEKINESIKVFGIEPKKVFERKKNFSKFNSVSETTLNGYKTTSSEIFEESLRYESIELDCSKDTCLKAYVTYIYLYKKMLNSPDILNEKLIGLKNSLNIYLSMNKENVELENFEAFSYVFNNIETEILKTNGFLKTLLGESLVNLDSVRYILRKLNKEDILNLLMN